MSREYYSDVAIMAAVNNSGKYLYTYHGMNIIMDDYAIINNYILSQNEIDIKSRNSVLMDNLKWLFEKFKQNMKKWVLWLARKKSVIWNQIWFSPAELIILVIVSLISYHCLLNKYYNSSINEG